MRKIVQNKRLDREGKLNGALLNLCREVMALERGEEVSVVVPELKAEILVKLSIAVDEWGLSRLQVDVIDVYMDESKMSELEYKIFEHNDVTVIEAVSENADFYIYECKECEVFEKRIREVTNKIDDLEKETGIDFIGFYLGEE